MPNARIALPDFSYQFELLLEIIKRFAYPARQVVHQNQLLRFTNGVLVSYTQADNNIIVYSPTAEITPSSIHTSQQLLGLDVNFAPFYNYAQADEKLWQIIQPMVGLPIFRTETIFEALITLIIEQHITWKNALRYQRTLMEIFETGQLYGDVIVYDFPSSQQLAQATSEQLRPLKITNRRIDLIIRLAQEVVSGELDLEAIREMDATTAYQTLLKIKGVGHWTANNVLGRAFGLFPYISHNDVALQAAVQFYFHQDEGKKSAQQTIDTLEPYGEYAGLVGHFTLLRWVLDRYPIVD